MKQTQSKQKPRAQVQKTPILKKETQCREHGWIILDATGKTLGRFASEVAKILRGKHRPDYTPSVDCGDGVIVINATKIRVTGNKEAQKVYHRYTGHIGGMRKIPYRTQKERHPTRIITDAVEGMIPNNALGRKQCTRLRVFVGEEHGLEAQKPVKVTI